MSEKEEEKTKEKSSGKKIKAKKDFKFSHGKEIYEIKKGETVEVPEMFLANLKTEKVI